MRNYVIINGVNSLTIQGLAIKTLPPITKPIQRTLREEIDGRDGDLVTELGYGAYDKTIEIGLFGTFDIDEVIAYFNQKGTITFSNEADKVYYFQALEQVDYAELLKFRTANVVLHCQPFKYPLNETPLVEEYEYVEATGSNVTLDNTSEAIFNKIDLIGNTEQTQYTGKNKASNVYSDYTYTGSYALMPITLEQGQTYTMSATRIGELKTNYYNYGIVKDGTNYSTFVGLVTFVDYLTGTASTKTITIDDSYTNPKLVCYIQATNPQTKFDELFANYHIQFEKSNTATSYEPYVGGIPSPNPSYPQPIQVVSGDNEISITGKNLLEPNSFAQKVIDSPYSAYNVSTYDENTGALSIMMGNSSAVFDNFKENTRYTLIFKYNSTTNSLNLKIDYTDSTSQNINIATGVSSGVVRYVTTSGKSVKQISHSAGDSSGSRIIYLKESGIFEGVIETTDFEPFGKSYSVNLGVENLLDFDTILDYWGAVYTEEDNTYTLTDRGSFYANPYTLNLKVGETYTLSGNKVNQSSGNLRLEVLKDSTIVAIQRFSDEATESGHTFVVEAGHTYSIRGNYSTGIYPMIFSKPQLEKGSKVNSYSEYGTTPIELCKIGDYQDYIYKDNGSWYLHKEIGKVVFNGSENWVDWNVQEQTTFSHYLLDNVVAYNNSSGSDIRGFCDYFKVTANGNVYVISLGLRQVGGDLKRLYLTTPLEISTKEQLKEWFSTHNTTLDYVLETPINTLIEDTTLIEQLEELKNATSYEGQTNITQTNNDLPFILEVSTMELGSDTITIDNIGNIYSKPTLDLEGTGIVDIYLNDTQMFEVDLSEKNEIVIDTEKMEAYNPTDNTLANRQVTGDYSKFKLDSGENDLRFSGNLTKATITNYERWL